MSIGFSVCYNSFTAVNKKRRARKKALRFAGIVYSSFSIASAMSFTVFASKGLRRLPTFKRSK